MHVDLTLIWVSHIDTRLRVPGSSREDNRVVEAHGTCADVGIVVRRVHLNDLVRHVIVIDIVTVFYNTINCALTSIVHTSTATHYIVSSVTVTDSIGNR